MELQLRYHPTRAQEGDITAWVRFVRKVVDRFGPNRHVVAIQVTNEVNLTISKDSSDGAYGGARDALIRGVEAAKSEARRRHFGQLEIGFNWAYRGDPSSEQSFWNYLRDHGGRAFVRSLDWVGVDAYPGTFFPPFDTPSGERDALVNAFSTFRCYAAIPGIPATVPIHVEENGYPTGPGRSWSRAASCLAATSGVRGGTGPVPSCPVCTPGVMPNRSFGPGFGEAESCPKHGPDCALATGASARAARAASAAAHPCQLILPFASLRPYGREQPQP